MVITPENFVMIRWQEHGEKDVTDGQTDGRTDWSVLRAAWSQLKSGPLLIIKLVTSMIKQILQCITGSHFRDSKELLPYYNAESQKLETVVWNYIIALILARNYTAVLLSQVFTPKEMQKCDNYGPLRLHNIFQWAVLPFQVPYDVSKRYI